MRVCLLFLVSVLFAFAHQRFLGGNCAEMYGVCLSSVLGSGRLRLCFFGRLMLGEHFICGGSVYN